MGRSRFQKLTLIICSMGLKVSWNLAHTTEGASAVGGVVCGPVLSCYYREMTRRVGLTPVGLFHLDLHLHLQQGQSRTAVQEEKI